MVEYLLSSVFFMKKYYHLHQEYLDGLKKELTINYQTIKKA